LAQVLAPPATHRPTLFLELQRQSRRHPQAEEQWRMQRRLSLVEAI